MNARWRILCATALLCSLAAFGSQTAAGASIAPLSRSNYAVRAACAAPEPGRAGCLALGLEPRTVAARARIHPLATKGSPRTGVAKASECAASYPLGACLTPQDLNSAYFHGEQPEAPAAKPQTIAIVDAYNDFNAEADLNAYATEFGLPTCTKATGCFKQVGENGGEGTLSLPFPKTKAELEAFAKGTAAQREEAEEAEGWALEIATDIEVAHAICQNCHILLVEARSPGYHQLETAESRAVALHATEISNSWGGQEPESDSQAFNHPGVAITAATGDNGYLNWDWYAGRNQEGSPYFEGTDYPASSPHVISVGGTQLKLTAEGAWQSEAAWNSGGGGCSELFPAPLWQREVSDWAPVGCGENRANADISADADPLTGVSVYDSTPYPYEENGKKLTTVPHWVPIGGTSVASPIIASMIALAGGADGVVYPAQTIYSHLGEPALLHDVTAGGNGECDAEYVACSGSMSPLSPLDCGLEALICNATIGYDGPTGVGTPNGIGAFWVGEAPTGGGEEGEQKGTPSEEQGEPEGGPEGGEPEGGTPEGGEPEGNKAPAGDSNAGGDSGGAGSPSGTETPGTAPGRAKTSVHNVKQAPRISALALTAKARAALRRGQPTVAQLAFAVTLTKAATVHVRLALRVHSGPHTRWSSLPSTFSFAAIKGINRRRLHGSNGLMPGTYRLTLTPRGGRARSIVIRVF